MSIARQYGLVVGKDDLARDVVVEGLRARVAALEAEVGTMKPAFDRNAYHRAYMKNYMKGYMRRRRAGAKLCTSPQNGEVTLDV